MFRLWFGILVLAISAVAQPRIGDCPVFPRNNVWNTPIDKMPVHPLSSTWIATEGADANLHPDFGKEAAIPINTVPADQPKVPIKFTDGAAESDPGPYPIPPGAKQEPGDDAHLVVVQQGECILYEVYAAKPQPDGTWTGSSGAIFDLRTNTLRPDGWTSADAAGLPILPGLVRYDEVASGVIRHAIRLTVPRTRRYVYDWPARHYASRNEGEQFVPMGARFRLKANYDISGFHPMVQVILQALKTYGMIVADNGRAWFLTGAPDPRWDDEILAQLKRVKGSDLEAVNALSLQAGPHSAAALAAATSNRITVAFSENMTFDASAAGMQSVTLTGDVKASAVTNLEDGQAVSFLICQDAAGGRAFTWPSNVVGGMQVGTAAGKCSAQSFVSDGSKLYATTPGMTNM